MEEKMSFLVKDDDDVLDKYNEIWCKIKKTLNSKFHSMPDYGGKYIKGEVREFGVAIKKNFLGDETPKENVDYTCIACITIDSVMKIKKMNYLEECKYKIKKIKMSKFINTDLESESESESES